MLLVAHTVLLIVVIDHLVSDDPVENSETLLRLE